MKRRQLSELLFRLRNGFWCPHFVDCVMPLKRIDCFTPWRIEDKMRKHRWCTRCGRTEWA